MSERRDPDVDDRRADARLDRRARTRAGRRTDDPRQPWYLRRRIWLALASVLYVGWRRVVGRKNGT